MKFKCVVFRSLFSQVFLILYVFGVSLVMLGADKYFPNVPTAFGVTSVLLLFVFSAFISGILLLGYPVYLYFEKEKKRALQFLAFNGLWLMIFMLIFSLVLLFIKVL